MAPELFGAALLVIAAMVAITAVVRLRGRDGEQIRDALERSEARARLLFETSSEPMWVYELETLRIADANDAAARLLGHDRDRFRSMSVAELHADLSPRELRSGLDDGEHVARRADGSTIAATITSTPVHHDGRPALLCTVRETRTIVDGATDAILTIDIDGRIGSVNPAAIAMFGRDDLVGASVSDLLTAADGGTWSGPFPASGRDVVGHRGDGSTFPLELSVAAVDLGASTVSTVVARDLTERRALEQRVTSQATHDPLTGLPNRLLLLDRLASALARAERSGTPCAVLYCDVDRFKVINDSLGHTAGDALLFGIATRLRDAVRTGDTVARFGGDEFVVLAEGLADEGDAVRVADTLSRALDEPFRVGPNTLHVTASIGIAVGRPGRDVPDGLVRDADVAMSRAKRSGRARYEVFDADLRRQAMERLQIEGDLRRGLRGHEFVVYYQPEVSATTGRVVGLEALVRWDRPGAGQRSPAAFLPVAEETGLIVPIGEAVLEQACTEARGWHAALGDRAPTVWVNISARQLASIDLVALVERATREWLPAPGLLGLEITETDLVPDDDMSQRTMAALVDIGVTLAIDDFGTGYASLSYLQRFPADVVKVDQSFVRTLGEDRDATVLVKAMIDMAHSLGKKIVAEGVETDEQLARLRRLGADTLQGYLISPPRPARQIDALLLV
jgi:diguanylate cyclase (GGDEF)-like protein/PAS domain S-box-containing protein